jgi:hypothetical protein
MVETIDFHKHNSKKRAADTNQARGPGFDLPSRRLNGVWRLKILLRTGRASAVKESGVSLDHCDFLMIL